MQSHARWVADTSLPAGEIGIVRICTVFAGLDMSLGVDVPVLFETIILSGSRDRELHRYTSWEDAEQGHAAIVQLVQGHINQRTAATLKSARDLARQTLTLARKFSSSKSADSTLAGIQ